MSAQNAPSAQDRAVAGTPEYPAQPLSPALVARLYATAERLERPWRAAGLPDDLGSRMVAATLRSLDAQGYCLDPTEGAAHQALLQEATCRLRRFFLRNARRDAARAAQARRAGKAPMVSTDALLGEDWHPVTALYADDPLAGETGRALAAHLTQQGGFPEARAWAFVLRGAALEWDDIAYLLERMGHPATIAQLRQWSVRHFPQARRELLRLAERHEPFSSEEPTEALFG